MSSTALTPPASAAQTGSSSLHAPEGAQPPLGVLLLGYGLAGRVFHSPLIRATSGLSRRAIVTGDPTRRSQALADSPGVRLHATADEAWAEIDQMPEADIQLAVIAGANRTHYSQALAAIERGLNVVIDKPLAGDAAQAQLVADAAAAAGVQVHPFQNRRWDSDYLTLRAILASGELGFAHRLESRIERLRMLPKGNWRESADPADLGGVLLDFGAHLVDQAIELLGPVVSITAFARSVRDPLAADDDMQMVMVHDGGAISTLVGSQAAAFGEPRFVLLGTTGAVRIAESDTQEAALKDGIDPNSPNWGVEPALSAACLRTALDDGTITDTEVALAVGRWNSYYPAVVQAVTEGAPAPVAVEHAVANLRVLDAARQSVATGASVRLNPPAGHA